MLYVKDDNGNNILDENGNEMTYSVIHGNSNNPTYVHREMIHIDDDDINTENRHIVIKDGVNPNHAVSKGQLDNTKTEIINMIPSIAENAINELVQSSIQTALKNIHKPK